MEQTQLLPGASVRGRSPGGGRSRQPDHDVSNTRSLCTSLCVFVKGVCVCVCTGCLVCVYTVRCVCVFYSILIYYIFSYCYLSVSIEFYCTG